MRKLKARRLQYGIQNGVGIKRYSEFEGFPKRF